MNLFARSLLIVALVFLPGLARVASAQDSAPQGEPIVASIDPAALRYDYLVDGTLAQDDPAQRRFKTLQAAYAAAPAGTAEKRTVIGIKPNVYQLPGTAMDASLNVTKNYITLLGLTNNRRSVVLADNRGNKQGAGTETASNNGYVLVVDATGFSAKNLTILNYCNVDYEYPGDPSKNLKKRSGVITQAVALQASGDQHVYENVAVLSRLDTMFLRTTRSYFKDVYIEGTDDFIGGGQISVWEDSEVVFPTGGGVMAAGNVVFLRTKFSATKGLQFQKSPRSGVVLIDCVMPENNPRKRVAWVRDAPPPRQNQYYLTYRVKDARGKPAILHDGSSGPATFDYSRELSEREALAFNPWNLLRAPPGGAADDWDPAGVRAKYEGDAASSVIYRMTLSGTPASVRTGGPGATLGATLFPAWAPDRAVTWSTPSKALSLRRNSGADVVVTGNVTSSAEHVPVIATAANGLRATAWVYVEPAYLASPLLSRGPTLGTAARGKLAVHYAYDLAGRRDQSLITWSVCDDPGCAKPRVVAVSRDNQPLATYTLSPGDVGKFIQVGIQPKHNVSEPGAAVFAVSAKPIAASDLASSSISPNFRNFVATENSEYVSGRWTVLGTWTIEAGEKFVNGYGIRAGSQGAQLLYQNDAKRGDMQLELSMTPEKTEGTGFGSPGSPAEGDRIQKSDIYIKYDPRTKTGYSLRYWRTTQSHAKCMYQLYRISNGVGTPLDDKQVLTGVFKPSTQLVMKIIGTRFTVSARNDVDGETLSLAGTITPNDFGGAGVAWYGTVPRGNSNVYSRFQISYPGGGRETAALSAPGESSSELSASSSAHR